MCAHAVSISTRVAVSADLAPDLLAAWRRPTLTVVYATEALDHLVGERGQPTCGCLVGARGSNGTLGSNVVSCSSARSTGVGMLGIFDSEDGRAGIRTGERWPLGCGSWGSPQESALHQT